MTHLVITTCHTLSYLTHFAITACHTLKKYFSAALCNVKYVKNASKNELSHHCVKSMQVRSFFWCVFSRIWTEYEDLLPKSPYSVQVRENIDQKKNFVASYFSGSAICNKIITCVLLLTLKINRSYLHFHTTYGNHTWQTGELS